MERRVSEQHVILNAMKGSVKHLENKLSLLENEKSLLEKTTIKRMRRYSEKNTVVRRRVCRLAKSVATCFRWTTMCISRPIPKKVLKDRSVLEHFSKDQRQNWTARSEQSSRYSIGSGGGERVVPLQ